MDELREAAESMKRSYTAHDPEKASDEANTIHNPIVKGSEARARTLRRRRLNIRPARPFTLQPQKSVVPEQPATQPDPLPVAKEKLP